MFRKSSSSTISSLSSSSSSCRSSYSSGTASIIVHQPVVTPPRTTSLNFRQILLQSSQSSLLSLFEDEFEDIDLTEDGNNMSSAIATAIQLSSSGGGKNMSSLSRENASVIRHDSSPSSSSKKKENMFSRNLFRWNSRGNNTNKQHLIYHDNRVNEIQSSLDPIIQRPEFALISY